MIPEIAMTMLACARIGAVDSVIFAGFSTDAIAEYIYWRPMWENGGYSLFVLHMTATLFDICRSDVFACVTGHSYIGEYLNWMELIERSACVSSSKLKMSIHHDRTYIFVIFLIFEFWHETFEFLPTSKKSMDLFWTVAPLSCSSQRQSGTCSNVTKSRFSTRHQQPFKVWWGSVMMFQRSM